MTSTNVSGVGSGVPFEQEKWVFDCMGECITASTIGANTSVKKALEGGWG